MTDARSGDRSIGAETAPGVPFRILAITSDPIQIDRILQIARNAPCMGMGLMLRDPRHDPNSVRDLSRYLSTVSLPSNVFPISNGVAVPGTAGEHIPGRMLTSRIVEQQDRAESDSTHRSIVGASVHTMAELSAAESLRVDYATVSPIFAPTGKPTGPTLGVAGLQRFVESTSLPLFALGGITSDTAADCLQAGAYGIASIAWLQRDPLDRILECLASLIAQ